MSIGENLKRVREEKGITQAELAERAAISVYTISRIEVDATRYPRRETLAVLAKELGVPVEQLTGGNGEPVRPSTGRTSRVAVSRMTIGPWQISISADGKELSVLSRGTILSVRQGT